MEHATEKNDLKVPDGMKAFLINALREMMAVSGAQKGSLLLLRQDAGELELAAFFAPSQPPVIDGRWEAGAGVKGKVLAMRIPVLVKDITDDGRFEPNGFGHYRTPSFISIPLLDPRDVPVGVINLSDRSDGGRFNEQDLKFSSAMAVYAGIIADNFGIIEKLRQERDRLERQRELLAKYTSVGRLAAGIVHEINNPLDGIIRFTNMLLNLQEESSLPREYLLEIKNGLAKIEHVTRSLLQFSHHVNRKTMMIRNYVDLSKLVEEALIACEAKRRGDIQVRREIQVRRRLLDMGLSQVFISVIQNAFDAMPQGGALDIAASGDDSSVRISFSDSGVGIPAAVRERIFDPFYTDKNNAFRPGLGLAKCREIIDRYNGAIDVVCPGKGSIFSITLSSKFLEHD